MSFQSTPLPPIHLPSETKELTSARYAVFLIMSYEMRSPLKLPAGDLSRFWPKTDVPIEQKKD